MFLGLGKIRPEVTKILGVGSGSDLFQFGSATLHERNHSKARHHKCGLKTLTGLKHDFWVAILLVTVPISTR